MSGKNIAMKDWAAEGPRQRTSMIGGWLRYVCALAVFALCAATADAQTTWYVDDDTCPDVGSGTEVDPFCSIQDGIDAAFGGDAVEVAPGTYYESINFNGKAITLISSHGPAVTTIDGGGLDTVVRCGNSEAADTVLDGFTITGGSNNSGAGMRNWYSSPTVTNCVFSGNTALDEGGGMYNDYLSSPTVTNCIFTGNEANDGGGMCNDYFSSPAVTNCTFTGNTATNTGGGMTNIDEGSAMVANCIFWANTGGEIDNVTGGTVAVAYSNVEGGYAGEGNINADPVFDRGQRLGCFSPCTDAGNNAAPGLTGITSDLDGNPRFADDAGVTDTGDGTPPIVDMGAYERPADSYSSFAQYYVDHDTCPACGTGTEGDPFCRIQTAIDATCGDASEGSFIDVAAGTYYEAIDLSGKETFLNAPSGSLSTIVDATGLDASVVTCVDSADTFILIQSFTFTGGIGTIPPPPAEQRYGGGMYIKNSDPQISLCRFMGNTADFGAGIWNKASSPEISYCELSDNTAGSKGGGMYNYAGSSPTIEHCTFIGNTATGSHGGGMHNLDSSPTVTDCDFEANEAGTDGGGMYNEASDPTVTDCTFSGNTATSDGGGMSNWDYSSPTVANCMFSGNSASYGGGVYTSYGSLTVSECTFEGNTVSVYGGGMYNGFGTPTVTNCAFRGNHGTGGGMYNYGGSPTVSNCMFSGNTGVYGAGVYNDYSSNCALTNCTFSGNAASSAGGGLRNNNCSPTVTNCILWNNTGGEITQAGSGSPLVTYSDVQGGTGEPWFGEGCIDLDPLFADADGEDDIFGTEDDDVRLSDCSPCVDAGTNGAVPPEADPDLDGNPRFFDDSSVYDTGSGSPPIVDMGPYERQVNSTPGGTIHVPDDYDTIQGAIDAVKCSGTEIIVAPGTYFESINFHGKAITLRSSDGPEVTTIDAEGSGSVVECRSGEGPDTVLDGFTITGGYHHSGGGMYNWYSSPTVTNCIFSSNTAIDSGGGMYNQGGDPAVTDCTFSGNSAGHGGGMYNELGDPAVTDCTFINNTATYYGGGMHNAGNFPTVIGCIFRGNHGTGGGMYNDDADSTVINCTFSGNAGVFGAGVYNDNGSNAALINCTFSGNAAGSAGGGLRNHDSSPTLTNCILWANENGELTNVGTCNPTVTYSVVPGGAGEPWFGEGCIESDPRFVDADGVDDIFGTEDDNLRLLDDSPCVDQGDNSEVTELYDVEGYPRIMDGDGDLDLVVDMGACEYFADCNVNGLPDACDIDCTALDGFCDLPGCEESGDSNGNGVPDECEVYHPLPEDSLGVTCVEDEECDFDARCVQGVCYAPKSRYLSIAPNPEQVSSTARRVRFDTGDTLGWVGEPYYAEPTSQHDGLWLADLAAEPHYALPWPDVVHVTGCEIAHASLCDVSGVHCDPNACPDGETCIHHAYHIQAIALGDDIGDELAYSEVLELRTAAVWGDTVSTCAGNECRPPNGVVGLDDVQAAIKYYQNNRVAPITWLDIDPSNAAQTPNQNIGIGDILKVIDGFQGKPYPGDGPLGCA